jgi:hypothetical protein
MEPNEALWNSRFEKYGQLAEILKWLKRFDISALTQCAPKLPLDGVNAKSECSIKYVGCSVAQLVVRWLAGPRSILGSVPHGGSRSAH